MAEPADEMQLIGRVLCNPHRYIPERSLPALQTFLSGYEMACHHLCRPFRQAVESGHFGGWLSRRIPYDPTDSIGPVQVIESMFDEPLAAFELYLRLLDDYRSDSPMTPPTSRAPGEFTGATRIMAMVNCLREKMPMYLGARSLMRLYSFAQGYELAHVDLQMSSEDLEQFQGLQTWIKADLGGPTVSSWYRAILRIHPDDGSAVKAFYEKFDQYHRDRNLPDPPPLVVTIS